MRSTGFDAAKGDVLIILDADLTMPRSNTRSSGKHRAHKGEFINGFAPGLSDGRRARCDLFNSSPTSVFSLLFTWLLNQRVTDTLCGTKVLRARRLQAPARKAAATSATSIRSAISISYSEQSKLNLRRCRSPCSLRGSELRRNADIAVSSRRSSAEDGRVHVFPHQGVLNRRTAAPIDAEYGAVWESKPLLRRLQRHARAHGCRCAEGTTLEMAAVLVNSRPVSPASSLPISRSRRGSMWLPMRNACRLRPVRSPTSSWSTCYISRVSASFPRGGFASLRLGGRLVMIEPAITWGGSLFYRMLHHEPVRMRADPRPSANPMRGAIHMTQTRRFRPF